MYNVEKYAVAKNLNKKKRRAEEIPQWLRAFDALAEEPFQHPHSGSQLPATTF